MRSTIDTEAPRRRSSQTPLPAARARATSPPPDQPLDAADEILRANQQMEATLDEFLAGAVTRRSGNNTRQAGNPVFQRTQVADWEVSSFSIVPAAGPPPPPPSAAARRDAVPPAQQAPRPPPPPQQSTASVLASSIRGLPHRLFTRGTQTEEQEPRVFYPRGDAAPAAASASSSSSAVPPQRTHPKAASRPTPRPAPVPVVQQVEEEDYLNGYDEDSEVNET